MDIEIKSTPGDMANAIEGAAAKAFAGDLIRFIPVNGQPFQFSRQLNLTSPGPIHVEATGAVFQGPSILFGGVSGKRDGGTRWNGGVLNCQLAVRNDGYSWLTPMGITGGLSLIADDKCAESYLSFQVPGGVTNHGPAIQIQQTGDGWLNMVTFRDTPMCNLAGGPLIQDTNKMPVWTPSLWLFDHCSVEFPGPLYDCGIIKQHVWRDCYWEPAEQFTLGNLDVASRITFVRPTRGLTFMDDNRVRVEGNLQ